MNVFFRGDSGNGLRMSIANRFMWAPTSYCFEGAQRFLFGVFLVPTEIAPGDQQSHCDHKVFVAQLWGNTSSHNGFFLIAVFLPTIKNFEIRICFLLFPQEVGSTGWFQIDGDTTITNRSFASCSCFGHAPQSELPHQQEALVPVTSNPYTTKNGHHRVDGKVHQHYEGGSFWTFEFPCLWKAR